MSVKLADFVGQPVELHPATDLWMRGARYGKIRGVATKKGQTIILIKSDHREVKKMVRLTPDYVIARWPEHEGKLLSEIING